MEPLTIKQQVLFFRRVGLLLAPHWKRTTVAGLLAAVGCLLNLPIPLLVEGLIDDVATGAGGGAPYIYVLLLIGTYLGQSIVSAMQSCTIAWVGLAIVCELRHRLYAKLQHVGLAFYDKTPAGRIISRIMDDSASAQALVSGPTLSAMTDVTTAFIVSLLLLWRCPILGLAAFAFLPIHVVSIRWFGNRIRTGTLTVRDRLDKIFGHLKTKFDGVIVIKACAREEAEMADFAAQIAAAHEPRLQVQRMNAAMTGVSLAIAGLGSSLVFALGAWQVVQGRMTVGEAAAVSALAGLLFGPVNRLVDLASVLHQSHASLARLREILDAESDVKEPLQPVLLGSVHGRVEFDRVTFGYQKGRDVLQEISLRVEPGMKVAVVGPTGSGKTTLLNLLTRFFDPRRGEIRLDDVPIHRLGLAQLRRRIGVVAQEPVIFRQTVFDNIRYGAMQADELQVERAARAALVHDFVQHLPLGYATLVGEGGWKLSQGERQRIAIARALCKDPALVVLDEATSALDSVSEELIQAALKNLLGGRTSFVIAHRLSTVLDADLIVVLKEGRIVQTGKHDQLLKDREGVYWQLYWHQFAKDECHVVPTEPLEFAQ